MHSLSKKIALSLLVTSCGLALAFGQSKGSGLQGLEISSDKSPIEPYAIGLDKDFSTSVRSYSATVDSTNAKFIYITAKAFSFGDKLSVNGATAYSGIPFKTILSLGDNKFEITVSTSKGAKTVYNLLITQKDLSKAYKSELIQKGVWRIEDYAGFPSYEDMYLIEGKDKALLIDTGMGKGDLAAFVKTLTKLPVEVALTHGHGDHVGQVAQFSDTTVYMSEKDKAMLPKDLPTANFKWVKDGDVIGLGGDESLEIIEVAGHSSGSIMFLDSKAKILAVGDAIGSGSYVWMFIPNTPALDSYRDSLKKLEARLAGYDSLTFLVGHHWQERVPLSGSAGKQLVSDMRTVCDQVLSGEVVGTLSANWFGPSYEAKFRKASFGLAGLWYNPDNLVTK
jgi:glyoxylase-like metal-dependent hydrolase (beta-lactamase superfamily II)